MEYWFLLKHGIGPGTLPRDVEILDIVEDGHRDYVKLNRFLSTEELNFYDIEECCPPSVDGCDTRYGADMSNCFGSDAVDFGGAFDIENDMFFTRDEIDEFAYDTADKIQQLTQMTTDVAECYMLDTKTLQCVFAVSIDDSTEIECTATVKVDFRRIQKPNDLYKYQQQVINEVLHDIEDFQESMSN